ncbi:hypothetical protein ACJX0J_022722 [Zea mays]
MSMYSVCTCCIYNYTRDSTLCFLCHGSLLHHNNLYKTISLRTSIPHASLGIKKMVEIDDICHTLSKGIRNVVSNKPHMLKCELMSLPSIGFFADSLTSHELFIIFNNPTSIARDFDVCGFAALAAQRQDKYKEMKHEINIIIWIQLMLAALQLHKAVYIATIESQLNMILEIMQMIVVEIVGILPFLKITQFSTLEIPEEVFLVA